MTKKKRSPSLKEVAKQMTEDLIKAGGKTSLSKKDLDYLGVDPKKIRSRKK